MAELTNTSAEHILEIVQSQREFFKTDKTLPVDFRKKQLKAFKAIKKMV